MASYHKSFTYRGENSFDKGLIIVAFDPDVGFKETFLSMDNISDDYYDGTKKFNYGSRYNSSAEIQISLIKKDGSDMTMNEFRTYARWLTGARADSWLEMKVDDGEPLYSFLGKFTNLEQYKYDARTVGIRATFSSLSPWAFSNPISFGAAIAQELFFEDDGVLSTEDGTSSLYFDNGTLDFDESNDNINFNLLDNGVIYIDNTCEINVQNNTDDLYTYIYLDIDYINQNCSEISIKNVMIDEETIIKGIESNEKIALSSKQFILPYTKDFAGRWIPNTTKIFGDDFNFVWPRLIPGPNKLLVSGNGAGSVHFTYRYPMKIGDCAMDNDIYSGNLDCGCDGDGQGDCTVDKDALRLMLADVLG